VDNYLLTFMIVDFLKIHWLDTSDQTRLHVPNINMSVEMRKSRPDGNDHTSDCARGRRTWTSEASGCFVVGDLRIDEKCTMGTRRRAGTPSELARLLLLL
jgi:hypothetical protein